MLKKKNTQTKFILAATILILSMLSKQAFSQTLGTLSGTVQDVSKAVLPGALVTATNVATGVKSTPTAIKRVLVWKADSPMIQRVRLGG
jgi:hypothetical protein